MELVGLHQYRGEFMKRDIQIHGVSVEPPEKLSEFKQKEGLDVILLSDQEELFISHLDLVDPHGNPFTRENCAQSASLFVDKERKIRWFLLTENYRVRPKPTRVLREISAYL